MYGLSILAKDFPTQILWCEERYFVLYSVKTLLGKWIKTIKLNGSTC